MMTKIDEVGSFVLLEEESINKVKSRGAIKKIKTKAQKRKIISSRRSVIKNVIKLYDKRYTTINAFINKNITPADLEEDVYLEEKPEYEEIIAERVRAGSAGSDDNKFYTPEESPKSIMPDLETEESAAERRKHERHGLKILTPQQMLSRKPISLVPLKAENNSQKLKNEIRQLFCSLCRPKKLYNLSQLGMMTLMCLMDLILFLIYKIILNISSKNMKLLKIILL